MNLTKKQKTKIKRIAGKHNLKLIIAFGSSVTGKTHKESDIDIAVLPKENGFDNQMYLDLNDKFTGLFNGRKIDLSFINRADPLLLSKICGDSVLLYGNLRAYRDLKLYSFKRYADYMPYFGMEEKYVNKFVREFASAG